MDAALRQTVNKSVIMGSFHAIGLKTKILQPDKGESLVYGYVFRLDIIITDHEDMTGKHSGLYLVICRPEGNGQQHFPFDNTRNTFSYHPLEPPFPGNEGVENVPLLA